MYTETSSSLVDGAPMNPEQGGLMISGSTAYAIKGDKKELIGKGSNEWSMSGTGIGFNSFYSPRHK